MKKVLLALFVTAGSVFALQAQTVAPIPNGSFDNWEGGSSPKPTGWDTLAGSTQRLSQIDYTVSGKSYTLKPQNGSFFLALATTYGTQNGQPVAYPGVISSKFAYTDRPNYFGAYIGYFPQGVQQNERFLMLITFTKWNSSTKMSDTVMASQVFLQNNSFIQPWALLKVNLQGAYRNSDAPDSAKFTIYSNVINPFAEGTTLLIDNMKFQNDEPTDVNELVYGKAGNDISNFSLYPNPMNQYANINYTTTEKSNVKLVVTDITGREVANLVNETQIAGDHQVRFERNGLKAGVYIYRLQAGSKVTSGKIIIAE